MKTIMLQTRDGEAVIELKPQEDVIIYAMVEQGNPPEALMWGTRIFISTDDPFVYREGFAGFVLTRF